jgi:Flp pilus assembly protein TadG
MAAIQRALRDVFRLAADTRGATAAVMAVILTTLVGMAGLGIETGLWFSEKRGYQTAADAGALAGAWQMAHQLTAGGTATLNTGTTNLADGTPAVAVPNAVSNGAPSSSDVTATQISGPAAQVVVSVPKSTLLANVYLSSLTIKATAVATVKSNQGCDVALYSCSNHWGVLAQGSGGLDLVGCKLVSDATGCDTSGSGPGNTSSVNINDTGFDVSGSTNIDAAGCTHTGGQFSCGTTGAVCDNGSPPITDPLASTFTTTPVSSTSVAGAPCSSSTTFVSGQFHYGKIRVTSGSVDLLPGTYYIDRNCAGGDGTLNTGNVSVTCSTCTGGVSGTGVTLIANGAITMNSLNNLSAPGTGAGQPYPGVLIYQPPPPGWSAPTNGSSWGNTNCTNFPGICDSLTGNASQTLQGAVYLPAGWLTFTGDERGSGCFEIIAYILHFTGNSTNGMNTSSCTGFIAVPTIYTAVLTQ